MLLSILIVSYNTHTLTRRTLESVIAQIESSSVLNQKSEIWLIDNNSSDDSVRMAKSLQKNFAELHIIENTKNVGFAAANNQAISQSTGQYILLLNSDTVVQADALEQMVHTFSDQHKDPSAALLSAAPGKINHLGILSCQLLNPDGTEQAQGGSLPTLLSLASQLLFLDDLPGIGRFFPSTQHTGKSQRHYPHRSLFAIDWVGGTAMMIKRELFAEVGLLDSNIFMYGEDIEFCMRAADHHWDVAILPSAKIIHFGSASSSSKNAIIGELKGYLYIWSKHKPLWQAPVVKTLLHFGVQLRILIFGTILKNRVKAALYRDAAIALKN